MTEYVHLFAMLGLLSCIYACARLLHYLYLKTQDTAEHSSVLAKVLMIVSLGLFGLSLPLTIVFTLINKLHNDRMYEIIRHETKSITLASAPISPPIQSSTSTIYPLKNDAWIFDELNHTIVDNVHRCMIQYATLPDRAHFPYPCLAAIYCLSTVRRNRFLLNNAYRNFIEHYSLLLKNTITDPTQISEIVVDCDLFWNTFPKMDHDPCSGNRVLDIAEYTLEHTFPDQDVPASASFQLAKAIVAIETEFNPKFRNTFIPVE